MSDDVHARATAAALLVHVREMIGAEPTADDLTGEAFVKSFACMSQAVAAAWEVLLDDIDEEVAARMAASGLHTSNERSRREAFVDVLNLLARYRTDTADG